MTLLRPIRATARLLTGLALLLISSELHAQAQASTGVIRGTVSDSSGAPLANATVTLRNVETNAERTLTTNERGVYVATLLRVGTYDVAARALGFLEEKKTALGLRLGESLEVPFALQPQAVQLQEITVAAQEREVPATRSETHLGVAAVEGLPNNGRNIFNYTTLTPNVAVVQGPDGDEISVGGQRGIHNNVSVDGADFNNPFFGEQRGGQRPAFTFNLDAVQDFVVVADGANAEFGRSSGGFINVITKSGTNQFHGSAHYFGKYDGLSADFSHTFANGSTSGFQPDFRQHQFGGTIGGPLVRDKAFFFLAADEDRADRSAAAGLRRHGIRRCASRRFRPDRPDQRRQCAPGQAGFPAEPETQRIPQVQLHLLQATERHVRRGLVGPERQRAREGLFSRGQRQPHLGLLLVAV